MGSLIDRESAAKEHATKSLKRFFSRLQKSGQMTTAREPRALALALYAYMLGLDTDYLRSPELYRMPEDASILTRLFFHPLKAEQQSIVEGKSRSVRIDLGGRHHIQN